MLMTPAADCWTRLELEASGIDAEEILDGLSRGIAAGFHKVDEA